MQTKLGNTVKDNFLDFTQLNMSILLECYPALKRYCIYLTKNHWDGEDLAQETVTKIIKKYIQNGNSNETITASLLYTVARNRWLDQMKMKKKETQLQTEPFFDPLSSYSDLHAVIDAMLSHFTVRQTGIFVLKEVFQYSISDLTEIFSATEGAIKSALFRIRNRLQTLHQEDGVFWQDKEETEQNEWIHVFIQSILEQNPKVLIDLFNMKKATKHTAPLSILSRSAGSTAFMLSAA
ncbi:sigma factor [Ectobacillus panaciterrae]|uniref:sigma factor n=1 Tax=Ectobacillus panaciterrae TaxID=363872 RepID=UPI000400DA13|nr:sigma factor [Ectobacillus panaciterrae]